MDRKPQTYSYINQSKYLQWYYNTDYEGYPAHLHHGNFFEFIVPLYNDFEVMVEEKVFHLKERDVLIIPPGKVHSLLPSKESGGRIVFMVNMDFMCLCENYSDIMSCRAPVLYLSRCNRGVHQEIYELILKMRNEYYHQYLFRDTYIYSLILKIFVILSRSGLYEPLVADESKVNKKREYFLQVQEYLKIHLQEALSLEAVAAEFGFSKYHFARLFKDSIQMTFNQYLSALRMEQAEQLLEHSSWLTVQEIGNRCGYNSYAAFVKAFKKQYGCTPREYKRDCAYEKRQH